MSALCGKRESYPPIVRRSCVRITTSGERIKLRPRRHICQIHSLPAHFVQVDSLSWGSIHSCLDGGDSVENSRNRPYTSPMLGSDSINAVARAKLPGARASSADNKTTYFPVARSRPSL